MQKIRLIFLMSLLMASCAPKGELTRTIHPPHQKFLDRTATVRPEKDTEVKAVDGQLTPGLPESCQLLSDNPFCLSCEIEGIHLSRCYSYKGRFQADEQCRFSRDYFKCLMKDPPFALYIDYRNSEEKLFHENVSSWLTTVHDIWDSKLNEEEKVESERLLSALDLTSQAIISKNRFDKVDEEKLAELMKPKDPKGLSFIREYLAKVEAERLKSELRLSKVLIHLDELEAKLHGKSELFTKFGTLSLDGLEVE